MSALDTVTLVIAGVLGGLAGSIAGFASVATYPALLAVGLPPVAANVTNTVALVFNGIGSAWGSRPELAGQWRWLARRAPIAALGGGVGATLLLTTPADAFEKLVPILLGMASVAIVVPRRPGPAGGVRHRGAVAAEVLAIFGIALYGGYFGAAAGVLFLAMLLHLGSASLAHANAAKNVLLGLANTVAALVFVFLAPVHWPQMIVLGLGGLVGARLGPVVVRHAPATPLRVLIGVAGLVLAVRLGLHAYRPA
ncbi:sulfite exporter TauE/SafE family protein [Mycolicibacterium sp. CBM1]